MFFVNDFAERHYKSFKVEKLYILLFHLTVGSSFSTIYLYGEHEYTWPFLCFIMLYVFFFFGKDYVVCLNMNIILFKIKIVGLRS